MIWLWKLKLTDALREFFGSESMKIVVSVWSLETALLLFTAYKGCGTAYLPIALLLMVFTAVGCGIAFHYNADRYLLIVVLVLLNLGFMVQGIEAGSDTEVLPFLLKLITVMITAVAAAALYRTFASFLAGDGMLWAMMILQLLICAGMLAYKLAVRKSLGTVISIGGFTPFELVKILYLFVAAGLLCKEETEAVLFHRLVLSREQLLIIHTAVLSLFFLVASELGTLMIVYLTGLAMLGIFGKSRKFFWVLLGLSLVGLLSVWVLCDRYFYPLLAAGELSLPGVAEKVIKRFGTALHPEKAMGGTGYQGTLGLEALAIGGPLGIETERYRLALPMAANDFVFANLVQTCGVLMGILVLLMFFALLRRGLFIAGRCEDRYFQGVGMGITFVITLEALVHVGYNIAMLPITGIPLYFLSQGFTAILTGSVLVAILLVLSADMAERSRE